MKELETFSKNHEILIINDGSNDSTEILLKQFNFCKIINLNKNYGKGFAIKSGLKESKYGKILITDGDLELKTSELKKLMILDKSKSINYVLGNRFNKIILTESLWSFGNILFTNLFNFILKTDIPDALCCAKSFYKEDVNIDNLKSNGFDIDIEILSILIKKNRNYKIEQLTYNRRNIMQGKKLRIIDSFFIFFRILFIR